MLVTHRKELPGTQRVYLNSNNTVFVELPGIDSQSAQLIGEVTQQKKRRRILDDLQISNAYWV